MNSERRDTETKERKKGRKKERTKEEEKERNNNNQRHMNLHNEMRPIGCQTQSPTKVESGGRRIFVFHWKEAVTSVT